MLVSGCLGLVFALLARDRIRADGLFARPAFGLVAAFAGLMLVPCALYLAWAHPDWSWMYLVDASALSSALFAPAWAVVQVFALLVGWVAGGRLAKTRNQRAVLIALGAAGLALVGSIVALADRLSLYGTYETVAHEVGFGLMEVKLGYVLIVLAIAMAVAAAQIGLELARDSRRIRVR